MLGTKFVYRFSLYLFIGWIAVTSLYIHTYETVEVVPTSSPTFTIPKRDRMDLAMQQEFDRTKDPVLGYVPRERLYQAFLYAEELRNNTDGKAAITGLSWQERGPNNVGGRTRAIWIDLSDNTHKTVWAGGVGGGLWKTSDITASSPDWTPVNNFFDNLAITTIVQDPSSHTTMYFGTGEGWYNGDAVTGDGIWKSTDGGSTWTQLSSTAGVSNFEFVQKIVIDGSSKIYAATRSNTNSLGGIMMSSNGGTSWTRYDGDGTSPDGAADVEIAANGDIYASFGIMYSDGIYKSTNSGSSWTNVWSNSNAQRIELACAPSNSDVVYAVTQRGSTYGLFNIYKTINGGSGWTAVTKPTWHDQGSCSSTSSDFTRSQGWYDLAAAVDPNDEDRVMVGGVDIMASSDGGSTWSQISNWASSCFQYVHADQHAIIFAPNQSDTVYFGNDGGVYMSVNGSASTPTITRKDSTYRTTQFYACAMHPTRNSNYFLAGAQDNGTQSFSSVGIQGTTEATGGDGAFCHIDQNQTNYQFASYVYNNFFRSTNSGTNWSYISLGYTGQFINPSDYDNTQNKMYSAHWAGYYLRWNNPQSGTTKNNVSVSQFSSGYVSAVTVSPNIDNNVYFGLENGRIVKVTGANTGASKSGTNLTSGSMPSSSTVSSIEIEDGDENHMLVTFSNYGVNSVWESTDNGSSWTSVEGNLPDMPIRWALFSPISSTQALVATELGIWSTNNLNGGSTNWQPSNGGFANVRTDMLQIRSSDSSMIAATHGRGLFFSNSFSASSGSALPITLASFEGRSKGNYNLLSWITSTESNHRGFQLQKADNGKDFSFVAFIQGASNSTEDRHYHYKDHSVKSRITYYRLKSIDLDNSESFSDIIAVENIDEQPTTIISATPNPFVNDIHLTFNRPLTSKAVFTLIDISGERIASFTSNNENSADVSVKFDVADLPAGIYFLKVTSGELNILHKLLKL